MAIGAVVLAAGASTRYGRPKQIELLPAVLDALMRSPVDEVVVVEGAYSLSQGLSPAGLSPSRWFSVIRCENWAEGPGASLRAGLEAMPDEVTHAVVVLADGPDLDPAAVARVLEHRHEDDAVAATYDGTRSHPVVLARGAWASVPVEGARALEPHLVDCSDLKPPGDVDYPAGREQDKDL